MIISVVAYLIIGIGLGLAIWSSPKSSYEERIGIRLAACTIAAIVWPIMIMWAIFAKMFK